MIAPLNRNQADNPAAYDNTTAALGSLDRGSWFLVLGSGS